MRNQFFLKQTLDDPVLVYPSMTSTTQAYEDYLMYSQYDSARVVTLEEFKKACKGFHRSNEIVRSHFKLTQLQQCLAKAAGLSDFQQLALNSYLVIEQDILYKELKKSVSDKEMSSITWQLEQTFFNSLFITTGRGNKLYLSICDLGLDGYYVEPTPYITDQPSPYTQPDTTFIELGADVALAASDWSLFLEQVGTLLNEEGEDLIEELSRQGEYMFNELESVRPLDNAYDYLLYRPELAEKLKRSMTRGDLLKQLSIFYQLETDYDTPLSELIEHCEEYVEQYLS